MNICCTRNFQKGIFICSSLTPDYHVPDLRKCDVCTDTATCRTKGDETGKLPGHERANGGDRTRFIYFCITAPPSVETGDSKRTCCCWGGTSLFHNSGTVMEDANAYVRLSGRVHRLMYRLFFGVSGCWQRWLFLRDLRFDAYLA